MKKTFLTLIALCALCTFATAQTQIRIGGASAREAGVEPLDSAYLKCSYTLHFVQDAEKPENTRSEEMLLLVGKQMSHFFSYTEFQTDSLRATMSAEQLIASVQSGGFKTGAFKYHLFKNYPSGKITTTDAIMMNNYRYEEPYEKPEWEILPDTMNILGYSAQKATTSFRGRDYVAWFTMEIPISNGPWKFTGLPGLILNIADTENHYVFECSGIETPQEKIVIGMKKLNYMKVSKKDFNKVYERFRKDPIGSTSNSNPNVRIVMKNQDGTPITSQNAPKIPHNPIELE